MAHTTFSVGMSVRQEPRAVATLGMGVAAALLYALFHVGPLLGALAVVCPMPLMVHRLRGGLGAGLLATAVAAAGVLALFSTGSALLFLAAFVAPGLLIAEGLVRGRGLLRGCAWAFALLSLEVAAALLGAAPQMATLLLEPIEQMSAPQFLEGLQRGGMQPERVELWAEQARTWHDVLAVVYPGTFVVLAALVVLANAALLRTYLARHDPGWLEGGEFEELRWSLALVPVFLFAGLGVVWSVTRPLSYNLLLVLGFFFALQGVAVMAYYVHRLAGPPMLRLVVMVLVLLNPWASQLLALLGLFDLFVDFRKWGRPSPA